MNFGFCKNKRKKLVVIDKSMDIIDDHMQVDNIIRKLLDLEMLKKIVLGNKRALVFNEQFRFLNIGNVPQTMKYLEQFELTREDKRAKRKKFDIEKFEQLEDNYDAVDLNKYLVSEYRDNWNL
jgi:hypothetical protein